MRSAQESWFCFRPNQLSQKLVLHENSYEDSSILKTNCWTAGCTKPLRFDTDMRDDHAYYQFRRSEMAQFLPNEYEKVLEIGCGEGGFAANLKPHCEIWGIEMDETSAQAASKVMKTVLIGAYDEVSNEIPKRYFDLVICNDVIEHMVDHDAFLMSIKKIMKDNGYLVASIPNVRYWVNLFRLLIEKDWKYREAGILDKIHLTHLFE